MDTSWNLRVSKYSLKVLALWVHCVKDMRLVLRWAVLFCIPGNHFCSGNHHHAQDPSVVVVVNSCVVLK
jgi:hypothetical protein